MRYVSMCVCVYVHEKNATLSIEVGNTAVIEINLLDSTIMPLKLILDSSKQYMMVSMVYWC